MKKLTLDLDALVVETFSTLPGGEAGGTVDAHAATFQCGGTANCTADTCAVNDTCAFVSCGDILCGTLRCGGDSYVATCNFVECGATGATSCNQPCAYTCAEKTCNAYETCGTRYPSCAATCTPDDCN